MFYAQIRIFLIGFTILTLASVSGCTTPLGYHLMASFPHKDAVQLTIFLEDQVNLETYCQIAQEEIKNLQQLHKRNSKSDSLPIYEIRLDFHKRTYPHGKLASIIVNNEEFNIQSTSYFDPEHWEIYLY